MGGKLVLSLLREIVSVLAVEKKNNMLPVLVILIGHPSLSSSDTLNKWGRLAASVFGDIFSNYLPPHGGLHPLQDAPRQGGRTRSAGRLGGSSRKHVVHLKGAPARRRAGSSIYQSTRIDRPGKISGPTTSRHLVLCVLSSSFAAGLMEILEFPLLFPAGGGWASVAAGQTGRARRRFVTARPLYIRAALMGRGPLWWTEEDASSSELLQEWRLAQYLEHEAGLLLATICT